MLLARRGRDISEADAIRAADVQQGGLTPEEVCKLADHYGLAASEKQLDFPSLADLVSGNRFPIVFLFRRPLDRVDATHAVIPLRCSKRYVTFLDPLRGKRRVTLRKFEEARRLVGRWVVECDLS